MIWFSLIFLAIAVSFDALAIGVTYSLNQIQIPLGSKLILSLISGCTFFFSMLLGMQLEKQLCSFNTGFLSGVIFIFLGLYNLWRSYKTNKKSPFLINWRVPIFGLIIQVFQEPLSADADHSKHITGPEAFVLGSALALDAIAAGFGAAILNLPLLPTVLAITLGSLTMISGGLVLGNKLQAQHKQYFDWRWIPGTIIILLGFVKIFF